jgi:hypothetical protein
MVRMVGMLVAASLLAGCTQVFSDPIPSIRFEGQRYFSIWTAAMQIDAADLVSVGTAEEVASGDVEGVAVLALAGVNRNDAVIMKTKPGTTVSYLLFVREGVLRAADGSVLPLGRIDGICQYILQPSKEGC